MIVTPIYTFNDNYVWLITAEGENACAVVDPGDAAPVIEAVETKGLELVTILLTHHHKDHTGGVRDLVDYCSCSVFGPANVVSALDGVVTDGQDIALLELNLHLKVMAIPGHTLDHVAYYGENCLFCADTVFSVGCGRVFEGTFEQMYQSLEKIRQLPKGTMLYPAHEYTLANMEFARMLEPENDALRLAQVNTKALRDKCQPSLPTRLEIELEINPFLRCDHPSIIQAAERYVGHRLESAEQVFAVIRRWKDNY